MTRRIPAALRKRHAQLYDTRVAMRELDRLQARILRALVQEDWELLKELRGPAVQLAAKLGLPV